MNESSSRISICSKATPLGTWLVSTDPETMKISHVTYGFVYYLTNSQFPTFELTTNRKIYDLIIAVAQHRTGLAEWDASDEIVSDYIKDWQPEFDDRLLMNLVADFLRVRPHDSMRGMVDYFEHKHSYCLERMKIIDLLEQLIITGEIDRIPSMHMAPSEMEDIGRLAKKWLTAENDG